jgi:hypothetical protein
MHLSENHDLSIKDILKKYIIANPKKAEGSTKEKVKEKQNRGNRLIKLKIGS